ncbi:MAG: outer membrane protein assembly factor BamD [Waddliaceae bacterium]|jgi:outer membrane protein assembly factor BamD (BamD/ComL family)|nr:outer membrane protein assembly factor BamD [Waddliaceae bacterium]MBT3578678.1 outer membrane protein assembly factor BamD [Waddliaceae bacterium]MBT4445397.1 outer membrane protein assembly factor BamD [Waddliaceae bacterium]MBT6928335.1 outer membrane protein assembly factor BamD [Waddliaceae bacterium]MBT7265021.1 outer membrane protein assembly factor BamD [Waddliaceae bacterium]
MKKNVIFALITTSIMIAAAAPAEAAYVVREGRLIKKQYAAKYSAEDHYDLGLKALEKKKWKKAIEQFKVLKVNYPESTLIPSSIFYLGVAYFQNNDIDMANKHFIAYLNMPDHTTFFEKTWEFRYAVAEKLRKGAQKHLFGLEAMPKIVVDRSSALEIYDSLITALPGKEVAIKAMFSKGQLLEAMDDNVEAADVYNTIIHKHPKHELAAESFLAVARLYKKQSAKSANNFDVLQLAKINAACFAKEFPKNPKTKEVNAFVADMEEDYAKNLYNTGKFYEKIKKPKASALYYFRVLQQFPSTTSAKDCNKRLDALHKEVAELELHIDASENPSA